MYDIFEKDKDLKPFNTLALGGKSKYYYEPLTQNEFIKAIKFATKEKLKYYIIGNGSNIILPDEDFDGLIINTRKYNDISITGDMIKMDAGVYIPQVSSALLKLGYTNFSWSASLPGTIGASIIINAGCYGKELSSDLISVEIFDGEKVVELLKEDIDFSYRKSNIKDIVLSASFRLEKGDVEKAKEEIKENTLKRISSQPLKEKNAGSTFKNPEGTSAGKLIDEAGLKGKNINGAKVSLVHANFLINKSDATSKDLKDLINLVKSEVKKKHNVELECENIIVEWDNV